MEKNSDNLDILSSIWILACNDDIPQITYKGIIYRLGLPSDFDVKKLVHLRGELFRKKTTESQLRNWKLEMLQGKMLPSWIQELPTNERAKAINELAVDDVFRSQFRSKSDSPKSEIEIINWGLEHIDRLRKRNFEDKQEKTRNFSSIWIPIFTSFIAFVAIFSGAYVQYQNNKIQATIKNYEIQLKPKQEGYTTFMKSVSKAYYSANLRNADQMYESLDLMESSFYILEPFLSIEKRKLIWTEYQRFSLFCESTYDNNSQKSTNQFICFKTYFRKVIYSDLFFKAQHSR